MRAKDICNDETLTDLEKWERIYGTDYVGNLPQHKKHLHVGNCWCPCPYDSAATDLRTRHLLGLSDTDPLPTKIPHTDGTKNYFMKPDYRGVWGNVCTFDNCDYYLNTGKRYFYR